MKNPLSFKKCRVPKERLDSHFNRCLRWAARSVLIFALQSLALPGKADYPICTSGLTTPDNTNPTYHTGGAAFTTITITSSNQTAGLFSDNGGSYPIDGDFYISESGSGFDFCSAGVFHEGFTTTAVVAANHEWRRAANGGSGSLSPDWQVYKNITNHSATAETVVTVLGSTSHNPVLHTFRVLS